MVRWLVPVLGGGDGDGDGEGEGDTASMQIIGDIQQAVSFSTLASQSVDVWLHVKWDIESKCVYGLFCSATGPAQHTDFPAS